MYDSFRAVFGNVNVRETDQEIVISGVNAKDMVRDMDKLWKTTRLTANMFNTISSRSLTFYKYFAPEVMYMLENIKFYRSRWTSIKAINFVREELMAKTWLKNTLPIDANTVPGRLDFTKLNNMTFTPESYQMDWFKSYDHRLNQYGLRGDLLAAAAGTGKTYSTCAVAEMLDAELIVVVVPRNVMETTWLPSIKEMYKTKQTVWHSMDPRPYKGERFIICHHEMLGTLEEMLRDPEVYQGKKIVTILDESHFMNDPNSVRSMAYQNICRILGSNDNILASGTPVKALGSELITLMRVIDPLFTPAVEAKFRKMFGKEASKGLDIIRHRMGIISFKVEKSELKLQPPIMRAYPIKIPNGERFTLPAIRKDMEQFIKERVEYYKKRRPEDVKFWDDCIQLLRKSITTKEQLVDFNEYLSWVDLIAKSPDPRYLGDEMKSANKYEKDVFERALPKDYVARFRDVKSVIKYTHLKIQGEVLGRVVGGKRIEAHVAMVPYIDWVGITESTEKKTVVFTSFVEVIEAADTFTAKLGMKPIMAYGKTSGDLSGLVGRFEKNQQLNPLLATYASLSTGVRLTMADTMILVNAPFRGYILEQAISRIYRMGQDSQTYVYQCTLDTGEIPNISTRSADILEWSQQQVQAIMGYAVQYQEGDTYGVSELGAAALEAFAKEKEIYDDNVLFKSFLQKSFEQYDIVISDEDFVLTTVTKRSAVPAYMR